MLQERRQDLIFGAIFGAWLGGFYAFASHAVNWLFMPDIPLLPPSGSFSMYLIRYVFIGLALGLISSLPENRYVGVALGGFVMATGITVLNLYNLQGTDNFVRGLFMLLYTFLPTIVLMAPLALVIRLGVDAQHIERDRPELRPRRVIIPALLSMVALLFASFSLHSEPVRQAFNYTHNMVAEGLMAPNQSALPEPLQGVRGFLENARGPYRLSWSDRVDTFMGPVPQEKELSQFLIITHFDNGFTMACVYSSNRAVPNCTNY